MDGPWQMGAKTPAEYGRIAAEAAKLMKWVDPAIELAACGSSGRNMPTFGTWEDVVLEHCFDHVEYISLHTYLNDYARDTLAFLASVDLVDAFIEEVTAIADAVAARRRSGKRIMLSFDEWNVWYRTRRPEDRVRPGWPIAPALLEERYTMRRARLRRHLHRAAQPRRPGQGRVPGAAGQRDRADHGRDRRPGLATDDLPPFAHASNFGRGRVLRAQWMRRPMRPATTIPGAPRAAVSAAHGAVSGSPRCTTSTRAA